MCVRAETSLKGLGTHEDSNDRIVVWIFHVVGHLLYNIEETSHKVIVDICCRCVSLEQFSSSLPAHLNVRARSSVFSTSHRVAP